MSCKLNVNDGSIFNERNGQVLFLYQGDSLETFTKSWYSSPFMPIQTEERLWIKVIFSRYLVSPGNSVLSMSLK